MATQQDTFNFVAQHLLKQNQRAQVELDGSYLCRYRTDGGLRCAVGCLIPDELYTPQMEGESVGNLLRCFPHLKTVPLINGFQDLLERLQCIHDSQVPENWRRELRGMAKRIMLDTAVLDRKCADCGAAIPDDQPLCNCNLSGDLA